MEPKSGDSVAPGRGHRERAVPLRNDLGAIEGWYGTNTDIEDRKRAEALLAGENRLLQMLAEGDSLGRLTTWPRPRSSRVSAERTRGSARLVARSIAKVDSSQRIPNGLATVAG